MTHLIFAVQIGASLYWYFYTEGKRRRLQVVLLTGSATLFTLDGFKLTKKRTRNVLIYA